MKEIKKQCNKCGKVKGLVGFYKEKRGKCGVKGTCIECAKKEYKEWRKANPEKAREKNKKWRENKYKEWYKANSEKVREKNKKWRKANSEKVRERNKKWREDNPEKAKEIDRRWRKANPEKVRERARKWYENNPEKAVIRRLRDENGINNPPPELVELRVQLVKIKRELKCKTSKV